MVKDPWAPIREARLAREAAAAAAEEKEREDEFAVLSMAMERLSKPGPAGAPGMAGEAGPAGPQGSPGRSAPKLLRAKYERDMRQIVGPVSGEMVWADLTVGATLYFDDGSKEHATIIRGADGRAESMAMDVA